MASTLRSDLSTSAVAAGFVAVLVGFTSSVAIVFAGADALGAGEAVRSSWMLALGIGMALGCIVPSLAWRVPFVAAWSTPGAALLASTAGGVTLPEATGAFLLSSALIAIAGFSGAFERLMNRIPLALAGAMLAGVLLRFGLGVFESLPRQPLLVGAMALAFVAGRRWLPRYAVILALLAGIAVAASQGLLHLGDVHVAIARPVWTSPEWSPRVLVGVGLPLFVVTMVSQNLPGVAALRASGYLATPTSAAPAAPVSPVIGFNGLLGLLLAPLGGFALNLAAITAAICMGREAHEDPRRRYVAAVSAGAFYGLVGLFGATVAALFAAFPRELVLAVAGLALLATIGNALSAALQDEPRRDGALVAFLVTASGISPWGIGSAFWGLVAGACVLWALRRSK